MPFGEKIHHLLLAQGSLDGGGLGGAVAAAVTGQRIGVPRDRDGSFEPKILKKRQKRLTGDGKPDVLGPDSQGGLWLYPPPAPAQPPNRWAPEARSARAGASTTPSWASVTSRATANPTCSAATAKAVCGSTPAPTQPPNRWAPGSRSQRAGASTTPSCSP
ncbi:hypothetical protein C3488_29155 [Streptomyces sp. Ru72]|nr:hypothetical protein C3488_29155 [Streptomyces sp. Ru72]